MRLRLLPKSRAGIVSDEVLDKGRFDAGEPFVDWMLYICRKWLPAVPDFAAPASVERLDSGTLIIVQDEPPNLSNESHLQNIQRVETALRAALHVPKD
jgi:hypothetical protein